MTDEEMSSSQHTTHHTQTMPQTRNPVRRIAALFKAMRPRQWTKNFALFIGIVFAQQLFVAVPLVRAILAFVIFCFASSCIYLLNDLLDLEKDREHPVKRNRPLASGLLPVSWAIAGIGVLLLLCAGLTVFLLSIPLADDLYSRWGGANLLFVGTVVAYLIMMVFYTTYLKHIVLIDVFVIAAGFVLRIVAGAVVIPVHISPWLYLVTCFLSLFLALSKRRHEIILLQDRAGNHRQILKEYSLPLLDQLIMVVVTCTLVSYSLYTIEGQTGNQRLALTIPLVLYGIFRYLYLVYVRMEGGSPEEVLLRDRHMIGTVMVCTISIVAILYLIP